MLVHRGVLAGRVTVTSDELPANTLILHLETGRGYMDTSVVGFYGKSSPKVAESEKQWRDLAHNIARFTMGADVILAGDRNARWGVPLNDLERRH